MNDPFSSQIELEITEKESAASDLLYLKQFEKMMKNLSTTDPDFIWLTTTLSIIHAFSLKDPSPLHFITARECLKVYKINEDRAVDILARELVIACHRLQNTIIDRISKLCNFPNLTSFLSRINEWGKEGNASMPFICTNDSCNAADIAFSEFLQSTGPRGKQSASVIKKSANKRYFQYRESKYHSNHRQDAWSLWISISPPSPFSPFLKILTDCIWKDLCEKKWEREKKNVAAITKGVLITTLTPYLTQDIKINVIQDTVICSSEMGQIISKIPCVDPKLVNLICKGMAGFSSLTGHKLLRWQVKTGFKNWIEEDEDPRLICTTGGYRGIVNLIGCNSDKNPEAIGLVKAILHAQAYAKFTYPQGGTGNMIILREIEKYRNGEPSKINIVLGEALLPNFTHFLPAGEKRRLIPITELPPLIGSKNTHASQALLQLFVLEEFSNQSDAVVKHEWIHVPPEKWNELASRAKLPKSYIEKVIKGWTEDHPLAKAFLRKHMDEYTLGESYSKVTDFLKDQGRQRLLGAKGGTKSSDAKKSYFLRKN